MSKAERPRPFTRAQALQNRRFLEALARTGNARLAARELGVHRSTYTKRRARSAAFARDWDAALAAAHARFHLSGGPRPPKACPERSRRSGERPPEPVPPRGASPRGEGDRVWTTRQRVVSGGATGRDCQSRTRSLGGEPTVTRLRSGRLQLRRAAPGCMTEAAEQLFLATLARTNNLRFSAAAAGFAHSTLLARSRRDPAFRARLRAASSAAGDRLAWQELCRASARADREPDPDAPIPPMSVEQALHHLHLHKPASRHRDRRPLPRPFADHAPAIWKKFDLLARALRHRDGPRGAAPGKEE